MYKLNFKHKRGQTATEYLIILAVVIVIALVVAQIMGGIPSIGGGASEQASRSKLMTAKVGISNFAMSEAKVKFQFVNNQANSIRIDGVTVDGKECFLIGTNSNPTLTPILKIGEKKTISCGSASAGAGTKFEYNLEITYTDLSNSASYTLNDLQLVGTSSSFECPEGYVAVPGGFVLADGSTVDDFCVAKYEMKNVGGVATSQADSPPWVSIDWYDSVSNCTALGSGYDLISDQQWMVLAENILNTPINDLNASAEGPQLGNGNSNGPNAFAAGDDPITTGCDLSKSLGDDSVNNYSSTCQVRGTGSDFGYTSNGASSWNMPYYSGADSRAKLRTHILSNGEVVWDLAGNVFEWSGEVLASIPGSGGWYNSVTDYTGIEWMEPSQKRDSTFGFGYRSTSDSSGVVALRGGNWGNGGNAGLFYVIGGLVPWDSDSSFGFRCVHSPGG